VQLGAHLGDLGVLFLLLLLFVLLDLHQVLEVLHAPVGEVQTICLVLVLDDLATHHLQFTILLVDLLVRGVVNALDVLVQLVAFGILLLDVGANFFYLARSSLDLVLRPPGFFFTLTKLLLDGLGFILELVDDLLRLLLGGFDFVILLIELFTDLVLERFQVGLLAFELLAQVRDLFILLRVVGRSSCRRRRGLSRFSSLCLLALDLLLQRGDLFVQRLRRCVRRALRARQFGRSLLSGTLSVLEFDLQLLDLLCLLLRLLLKFGHAVRLSGHKFVDVLFEFLLL
jgi:hypothetical protein